MASVKFNCPNHIVANALAILSERGELQSLINEYLQDANILEGNELDKFASPTFDDSDDPDHEVDLQFT